MENTLVAGTHEAMQREVDGPSNGFEVRYNPHNPADACLKDQPSWWGFGALSASALCFFVALITLVTWPTPFDK